MFFSDLLYRWFAFFPISEGLDNILLGGTGGPGYYSTLGWVTILIVVLVMSIFYFAVKPVRSPRWMWLLSMAIACFLNFLWAYLFVYVNKDNPTFNMGYTVTFWDCFGLGLDNSIISLAVGFVLSLILKFFSPVCRYIPF